jgi:two-component system, NtrC family, sensor kinase
MNHGECVEFLVGAERGLSDVLNGSEVLPLLRAAVDAGAVRAQVCAGTQSLWQWPQNVQTMPARPAQSIALEPLRLEGEIVAQVRIEAGKSDSFTGALAAMVAASLNTTIGANLKRMLTTEIHTQVVSQSYEDLLAANRQLSASEQQYRELAATLEIKVKERTAELERAWACMLRQEKMAAVGQLAAGMAHEINNPLGFILSNLNTLQKYVGRYVDMLEFFQHRIGPYLSADLQDAMRSRWRELRLDFITNDMSELLPQCVNGAERVKQIVADLRGFAHIDKPQVAPVNVKDALERTLAVMTPELPADARIHLQLGPLPMLIGQGALLCQAFMNLIRNALQANPGGLELNICGSLRDAEILLAFADNGPGIAENMRGRIFDPFFTTREVGQGIGLGLTVVHDAVETFGGRIEVGTSSQGGAEFMLFLPIPGDADG